MMAEVCWYTPVLARAAWGRTIAPEEVHAMKIEALQTCINDTCKLRDQLQVTITRLEAELCACMRPVKTLPPRKVI